MCIEKMEIGGSGCSSTPWSRCWIWSLLGGCENSFEIEKNSKDKGLSTHRHTSIETEGSERQISRGSQKQDEEDADIRWD